MSIHVNVFWELVGLVPFTEFDAENKFGRFDELLSVFHAEIGKS
jgi:hypothetical protein